MILRLALLVAAAASVLAAVWVWQAWRVLAWMVRI